MTPTKISNDGIELIKISEGFRSRAYLCPAGIPTIGFGSIRYKGKPVDMRLNITEEQAEEQLKVDVEKTEAQVRNLVKVDISQKQFDALVSFTYNIGAGAFKNSTLLRKLNNDDYEGAANEFKRWIRGGGRILGGLVTRRKAEEDLFREDMPQKNSQTENTQEQNPV